MLWIAERILLFVAELFTREVMLELSQFFAQLAGLWSAAVKS